MLKPLQLMFDRVRSFSESDTTRFSELLYAGEFILKFTTAAFVCSIEDDREKHRYRLLHGLVRANGIGDWSRALDDVLTGPSAANLPIGLQEARRAFTEKIGKTGWQYEAVANLQEVISGIDGNTAQLAEKLQLRSWFQMFAELRNKTRGHGAITPGTSAKLCRALNKSISIVGSRNPIFELPWIFIRRNMSGNYTVRTLATSSSDADSIKRFLSTSEDNFSDGIYLWTDYLRPVELIETDLDCADFFLANGDFRNDSYELHSLITDDRRRGDGTPYLAVPTGRPTSETEGRGELEIVGSAFSNLPRMASSPYVTRPRLEREVRDAIMNDRHAVITLKGRGGIGKTSLTLEVLRIVTTTDRYALILWFSARDIDLLVTGIKTVQPKVVTERDIADYYCNLVGLTERERTSKKSTQTIMSEHLRENPNGPTLFVFDNFETIRNPIDVFKFIDTNIRLPNKAIITTRFRDFKADFPIEVSGMEYEEADTLITRTAAQLRIEPLIGKTEKETIFEQSGGHPYVIKITLGAIADAGRFIKPANVIARKEEILDALFERTFASLLPVAARIFLTLSSWRSLVPQPAVEAVLLRNGSEQIDPEAGIDQLLRMSLIERTSADDGTDFLEVPLTAALFGKRKLEVSPIRAIIDSDLKFLQEIGATTKAGLKDGLGPKVEIFFRRIARRLSEGNNDLREMRPMLEFLARRHPPSWLQLASIEQESLNQAWKKNAAEYIRRYLETRPPTLQAQAAWQHLFSIYRMQGDAIAACDAFMKVADSAPPPYSEVSSMANWLNTDEKWKKILDTSGRKLLLTPLIRLMEARHSEATATDLSRLAWLHLLSGDVDRAMNTAQDGLRQQPESVYCRKIIERLSQPASIGTSIRGKPFRI